MIKKLNKEIVWFLYLMLIWIMPVFDMYISIDTFAFWGVFILSLLIYNFIKKRALSIGLIISLTIIVCIYRINYLITALPVLLLIISYIQTVKNLNNKKAEKENIFETISLLLFIAELIYSIIELSARATKVYPYIKSAVECLLWIFLLFTVFFIMTIKKDIVTEKKLNNAVKYKLRFIYFVAIFGVLVSGFAYFALNGQADVQSVNAEAIYWYVFILTVIINKDPYLCECAKNLEITMKRC